MGFGWLAEGGAGFDVGDVNVDWVFGPDFDLAAEAFVVFGKHFGGGGKEGKGFFGGAGVEGFV